MTILHTNDSTLPDDLTHINISRDIFQMETTKYNAYMELKQNTTTIKHFGLEFSIAYISN